MLDAHRRLVGPTLFLGDTGVGEDGPPFEFGNLDVEKIQEFDSCGQFSLRHNLAADVRSVLRLLGLGLARRYLFRCRRFILGCPSGHGEDHVETPTILPSSFSISSSAFDER